MITVGPVYNSITRRATLSSEFEPSLDGEDSPEETSPLLLPNRAPRQTTPGNSKSARSTFWDDNFGLFLVAVAQFSFSAMNMTVQVLNGSDEPVPILEIILVRTAITFIFSLSCMYWKRIPDPLLGPKGVRILLAVRGFAGLLAVFGIYFALQYLSLSDATVLTFMGPILTGISGGVILREPLSLGDSFAGFFSFFGVILIARPQFLFGSQQPISSEITPTQRMLSVTAALIGVLGLAGSFLSVRAIKDRAHPHHNIIALASQCVVVSTLGMILFKVPLVVPTYALGKAMLLLNAMFGILGQVLFTIGLQYETAGRGVLAYYSSIVFALIFDFTIFHTPPSTLSVIGTSIIVGSAIYITLTKQKTTPEPASDTSSDTTSEFSWASNEDNDLEA